MPGQEDIPFIAPPLEEICKSLSLDADEARIKSAALYIFEEDLDTKVILRRVKAPTLRTLCLRHLNDPTGTRAQMIEKLVSLRRYTNPQILALTLSCAYPD